MYCRNCGKELLDNSKFCPYCGTKVELVSQEEVPADAEVVEVTPVEVPADAEVVEVTPVEETVVSEMPVTNAVSDEVQVPKVWSVFALIGKIFGIVCISTFWIPFIGMGMLAFSIPGIVLSALGNKGKANVKVGNNASKGLTLNIVATILSVVCYILLIIILVVFELYFLDSYYYDYDYYYYY